MITLFLIGPTGHGLCLEQRPPEPRMARAEDMQNKMPVLAVSKLLTFRGNVDQREKVGRPAECGTVTPFESHGAYRP
jgi:hypothetical protein